MINLKLTKRLSSLLLAMLVAITLAACGGQNDAETKQTTEQTEAGTQSSENKEQSVVIELIKEKESVEKKEITIEEDDILMDVLKENFEIKEDKGFITSIDGIHAEKGKENKYGWLYEVNGKMADVGAADYKLKPGDKVTFEFQKF